MLRYIILAMFVAIAALEGPQIMQSLMDGDGSIGHSEVAARESGDVSAQSANTGAGKRGVRLSADRSGHYGTEIRVNNRWLKVLVDTGATAVSIPYEEAGRLGIRPPESDFTVRTQTANGIRFSAPVTLNEVRLGDIRLQNVEAMVSPPGALSVTLLGMSFLGRLSQVDIRSGELVMVQ